MLDNLEFGFEPNDDEEYATAYDLSLSDNPDTQVGLVFVDDDIDSKKITELFVSSPGLLSTVRRFVQWADNQPTRPRPNLDPIVADARALLNELDN